MAVSFKSALKSTMFAAVALSLGASASAASLTENFDGGVPAGWVKVNNSDPKGSTDWFQGNPLVFGSHQGAATSYIGANFNAGADVADISDWLILPTQTFNNGDKLSFFSRTVDGSLYPDRLEVRFSAVGGKDVGHTAGSVGTFTTLLLTINPNLDYFGYPEQWAQFNTTISGLAGATNGALAFRYVVEGGGPDGDNSNFIGIDTLSVTAVPEPSTYLMLGLGLGLLGVMRQRRARG
ncbi:choice-of-anchor J domain-containing protein [Rugamonas sp. CCM 8940]|nr:choice-of-anchor J domain-containing protein [Rugamonas sp. CCM 8940]